MSDSASDTKEWYLAQMIQELNADFEPANTVWVNHILIEAVSAEDAYAEAMEEGTHFANEEPIPDGGMRRSLFHGLHGLSYIGPELRHGTIVLCEWVRPRPENEIAAMIHTKDEYTMFQPRPPIEETGETEPQRPYIPSDAEWYLAYLLFELRTNLLKKKELCMVTALVHADSPDAACDIAPQVGHELARSGGFVPEYNRAFRGVYDVCVVHDDLEHGEEVIYEEHEDMLRDELQDLICAKEKLAVFSGQSLCF